MGRSLAPSEFSATKQSLLQQRLLRFFAVGCGVFIIASWLAAQIGLPGFTRLDLAETETGRMIFSGVLGDGEPVTLKWRNSLFGLDVSERFVAASGQIIQTEVTFADPRGITPPMPAPPQDLDDLYHTGGPFTVKGIARPFTRIVYRVSEIGEPKMQIKNRVVDFKREVGFGGRIILTTRQAAIPDILRGILFGYESK